MLIYDQLRISDDSKQLMMNFHVNTASYFDNVTLASVTVVAVSKTEDISETDCVPPTTGYIYKKVYTDGEREDAIVLDRAVLDTAFNNTDSEGHPKSEGATALVPFNGDNFGSLLYFVYVECSTTDENNPCIPCTSPTAMTTLGVTFDTTLLYQKMLQYTKQLNESCKIAKGFLDLVLLWNAFKAAIETEHYIAAIEFWNKLFRNVGVAGTSKPCGCHG